MSARWLGLLGVLALVGGLAGCPPGAATPVETGRCAKLYDRCVIEGGKLGVCDLAPPESCEAPPCMVCVDQH